MRSQDAEPSHQMLSQRLINLSVNQGYSGGFPAQFSITIATLPVLLIYLFLQRQDQAGPTAGTLKQP